MDAKEVTVPDKAASTVSTSQQGETLVPVVSAHKQGGQDQGVTATYADLSEKGDGSHSGPQICKICGKTYNEPDIKHIPSGVAWLSFSCLFICCFWWLSWIPFIVDQKHCNICKKPVKVCPYCYRRLDRPMV